MKRNIIILGHKGMGGALAITLHALQQQNIDIKIQTDSVENAKTLIKNVSDAYTHQLLAYKPKEYKAMTNATGSKYIGKQRQNFKRR